MKLAAAEKRTAQPHEAFISYSRKDKEFVRRLDDALQSRGRRAWVDWEDIRPTEEFMQAIFSAIEGADSFVFVLTPDSIASAVCRREISHAAAHNKRMVPIVVREVESQSVPEPLAKLNWIFCRESDDFNGAIESLISAFETDLEWVHAHTRLLTRALEWEAKKKSNSFVLRGEDLRSAEQWLARAGAQTERQPTSLQTEYIFGSRKAATRRQRSTLGAVSFGAIVAVVLAVAALISRNRAENERRNAEAATKRARHARDEAGKLIEFMSFNLRDKLQPLGRLDLLDEVNRKVADFYNAFADEAGSSELLRQKGAFLSNQGNVARAQGNLTEALRSYREGVTFFQQLSQREPGDLIWQRDISVALGSVAEVLRDQGDLPGALQNQRDAIAIMERLSRQQPESGAVSDDLAANYVNLADVQRDFGDFASASKSYGDALAISERLAQLEPNNIAWQRNFSLRLERVGDLQRAQDDLTGALETYRRSLDIAQKLADQDPRNAGWQSDLFSARMKFGDLQNALRDFAPALQSYQTALGMVQRLSSFDPANTDWLRDVSVACNQIGSLQLAHGKQAQAFASYRQALAIREQLVLHDPTNTSLQRDLSLSYDNIGDVSSEQGDVAGALESYRKSLALREHLTKQDGANSVWQRDLAIAYGKVGDMQSNQNDFKNALLNYRASISIAEAIANSGNVAAQETLWLNYQKLANLQAREDDLRPALQSYRKSLALLQELSARNPANLTTQGDLALAYALSGTTQAMVDGESEDEAHVMLEKARDILRRLQESGDLTAQQQLLLQSVEQSLFAATTESSQTTNKKRDTVSKRRKHR